MSENVYPTPHINAAPKDFAKTVLMPGDPLRSEFIAKEFLSEAVLVNDVRGVHGYTGSYNGRRISVMASGMGMPSIGIYSWELYNIFGVENIIRVGSAGALQKDIPLSSVVLGMAASTDSNYSSSFNLPGAYAPNADFDLLYKAYSIAEKKNIDCRVGNILSSDIFYNDNSSVNEIWAKMNVLAVEMEAAALYMNAQRASRRALAILTVSDQLITGEHLSAEERRTSFSDMITLSLETACGF